MDRPIASTRQVTFLVLAAAFFWWLIFGLELGQFWIDMAIVSPLLAFMAVRFGGNPFKGVRADARAWIWGAVSAAVLYAMFAVGNVLAGWLFSFGPEQIAGIYSIRFKAPEWVIALIFLFVTSPAEEILWRGFVQRWCMQKYGDVAGWILGSCLFAGIHLCTGNIMLVLSALVSGLFWGWLFLMTRNLWVCVINHALWCVSIFILWPIV